MQNMAFKRCASNKSLTKNGPINQSPSLLSLYGEKARLSGGEGSLGALLIFVGFSKVKYNIFNGQKEGLLFQAISLKL